MHEKNNLWTILSAWSILLLLALTTSPLGAAQREDGQDAEGRLTTAPRIPDPPTPEPLGAIIPALPTLAGPHAAATAVAFSEDFTTGGLDWTYTGLWHTTAIKSRSCCQSMWYGQESTQNYNTGGINSGEATSPLFQVPSNGVLEFSSWHQTEGGTNFDKKWIEVTNQYGQWLTSFGLPAGTMSVWQPVSYSLAGLAGQQVHLKFHFNTMDSYGNNYWGWFIDDIVVKEADTGVDITDPIIVALSSISHPDSNLWYNNWNPVFRVHAYDAGSGLRGFMHWVTEKTPANCTVEVFATGQITIISVPIEKFSDKFGEFTYSIRPIDNAGNCGETTTFRFNVDAILPVVRTKAPGPDETLSLFFPSDITIDYDDKDFYQNEKQDQAETKTSVSRSSILFFLDEVDRTADAIVTQNQLTFPAPFGFTVGDHLVEFRMKDTSVGADEVVDSWIFHVSPVSDADGDLIPDSAEPAICDQENKATTLDGSCAGAGNGDDYTPPVDAAKTIDDATKDGAELLNDLIDRLLPSGIGLHS